MKTKKFISLFVAIVLCLSSFTAFAAEEIFVVSAPQEEYVDYSDMLNWAYWNEGEDKPADLFFVCPTRGIIRGSFGCDRNT